MQIKNNQIFSATSSQATVYGNWIDVSNLVGMSIQVVGLEAGSTIWVEVSNDPNAMIDGAAIGPPSSAPTLSQFAAGATFQSGVSSLPAATYFVKTTFITKWGETTPSTQASLAVSAGNFLFVAAPTPSATQAPYVTGWNCYVGTVTGAEVLQTAPPFTPQRLADGIGTFGGTVNPLGPNSSTHFAISGALSLSQNFSMINGFQQTQWTVPSGDQSGGLGVGVNAVPPQGASGVGGQNLTSYCTASPNNVTDAPVAIFGQAAGTIDGQAIPAMAIWAPACMAWKWVRVCKTGGTVGTTAYIIGQNG